MSASSEPEDRGFTVHIGGEDVAALDRQAEWASRNWWLVLLVSVAAIVFGVIALTSPWGTLVALTWAAGLYFIYQGVTDFIAFFSRQRGWWAFMTGVIGVVAGIVILAYPIGSLFAMSLILGAALVVWGAAAVYTALSKPGQWRTWRAIMGGLMVILGIITLAWPGETVLVLTWLLGLNALVFGVFGILQAFALRSSRRRWEATKDELRKEELKRAA